MLSLGFRVLGVGVLITLYWLNPLVGLAALATVAGYVVVQQTSRTRSKIE